jgi:hypothetical protein
MELEKKKAAQGPLFLTWPWGSADELFADDGLWLILLLQAMPGGSSCAARRAPGEQ